LFLVAVYVAWVGIFDTQGQIRQTALLLGIGLAVFAMAACFALPERLQRTRRALSVVWALLALAVMALTLTAFIDY
jgi:hypothetical protein